jgi:hypothetical protein
VHALRAEIVKEGTPTHNGGNEEPSPTDGGVAPASDGIRVGYTNVRTTVAAHLVDAAIATARGVKLPASKLRLVTVAPPLTGPFWSLPNGSVMIADNPGTGCTEITRPEYLAAVWGLDLRDLPASVLSELTDRERARLAEALLPQDQDGAA